MTTINLTILTIAIGFTTCVQADPTYCGPYRCSAYDLQHDRRAEQRRYERELDRRDSLRAEQEQRDRAFDQMERQWENMLRRNEYEDQRRHNFYR